LLSSQEFTSSTTTTTRVYKAYKDGVPAFGNVINFRIRFVHKPPNNSPLANRIKEALGGKELAMVVSVRDGIVRIIRKESIPVGIVTTQTIEVMSMIFQTGLEEEDDIRTSDRFVQSRLSVDSNREHFDALPHPRIGLEKQWFHVLPVYEIGTLEH